MVTSEVLIFPQGCRGSGGGGVGHRVGGGGGRGGGGVEGGGSEGVAQAGGRGGEAPRQRTCERAASVGLLNSSPAATPGGAGGSADLEGDMVGERRRSGRVAASPAAALVEDASAAAAARAERMARYKEERRRQLASQFGAVGASTSSSSNEDSLRVRTTRTSRLRAAAAAAAAAAASTGPGNGGSPTLDTSRKEAWRSPRSGVNSSAAGSPRAGSSGAPDKAIAGPASSSDQHNNEGKSEVVPSTPGVPQSPHPSQQLQQQQQSALASPVSDVCRREKDKSGKRKSNLNRALNVEEVPQGIADPCDDGAAGRRRRRRVVSAYLEGASPRRRSPEPTSHSVADLSCRGGSAGSGAEHIPGRAVRKTSDTSFNYRNSDNWTLKQPEPQKEFYKGLGSGLNAFNRKTSASDPSNAPSPSNHARSPVEGVRSCIPSHQTPGAIKEDRRAFNLVQPKTGDVATNSTTSTTPPLGSSQGPLGNLRNTNGRLTYLPDGYGRPTDKTNGVLVPSATRPASSSSFLRKTPEPLPTTNGKATPERSSPTAGVTMRRKPVTAAITARRLPRPASYCSGVTPNGPEDTTQRSPLKRAQSGGSFGSDLGRLTSVHLRSARSVEGGAVSLDQRPGPAVPSPPPPPPIPAQECIIEEVVIAEENGDEAATEEDPLGMNGRDVLRERNIGTPSPPLVFGHHRHHPSSILKRRAGSGEEAASSSGSGSSSPSRPPPVSILKRKAPPPQDDMIVVSANHSVLGRATPPLCSEHTPQGILKKRPSLDESESRRSHSPLEIDYGAEFRPILKQPARPERRLSLEENNSTTTSILKQSRLNHREEDEALPPSPSFIPGGLASRVPGIPPPLFDAGLAPQEPRPILKRRSGSEETSEGSLGAAALLSEVPPRPILKRRAGSEEETAGGHHTASSDEKPPHPRPILKSSSSSASSSSSSSSRTFPPPLQRRSLDEATCERWRPVYDTEEDRIFHSSRLGGMPRRQRSEERPPGILRLRDSSDSLWGSMDTSGVGPLEVRPEGISGSSPRGRRSDSAPPGDCMGRSNSRPHTPPPSSVIWVDKSPTEGEMKPPAMMGRMSPSILPSTSRASSGNDSLSDMDRPRSARGSGSSRLSSGGRDSSRFLTQPVTLGELRELARLETVKVYRGSTTAPLLQFGELSDSAISGGRSLTRRLSEAWEKGVLRLRRGDPLEPLPVHPETSPSPGATGPTILESPKPQQSEPSPPPQPPTPRAPSPPKVEKVVEMQKVTSSEGGRASLGAQVKGAESSSGVVGSGGPEEDSGLSASVSARAQLFAQMAEERKGTSAASNAGRFRDRKDRRSCGGRFSTQPITSEEVTEATRQAESGATGPELDENDPAKLSLAERVRLFNQKILDERLPSANSNNSAAISDRRRSGGSRRLIQLGAGGDSRFRTQPVTTEEVREALFVNPHLSHSMSTSDTRSTGTSSPSYGNGFESNEASVVVVVKASDTEARPKGILKNSREASQEGAPEGKVGSSDSEGGEVVRSILKVNHSESSVSTPLEISSDLPQKSVLKKESSSGGMGGTSGASGRGYHDTHPVRSILKPESEWSERERAASSSGSSSTDTESSESSSSESESSGEMDDDDEGDRTLMAEEEVVEVGGKKGATNIANILRSVEAESSRHSSEEGGEEGGGGGGSSSSSGGREVRRIIRNDAVARRRQAGILRSQQQQQREEPKNTSALGVPSVTKSRSVGVLPPATPPSPSAQAKAGGPGPRPGPGSPFGARRFGAPIGQQFDPVAALAAATTRPHGGLVHSHTQPIPRQTAADGEDMLVGGSIAERLAALQKSGQSDWRKRVSRLNPEEELTEVTQSCNGSTPVSRVRSKSERSTESSDRDDEVGSPKGSKSLLAERKGKLVEATEGWRNRVGPSDAIGFSVAGKMGKSAPNAGSSLLPPTAATTTAALSTTPPSTSPLPLRRIKKTPKPARFRSKTSSNLASEAASLAASSSDAPEDFPNSLKRSQSAPGCDDGDLLQGLAGACKVGVPRADDETFMEFYKGLSVEKASEEQLDVKVDDFDCLSSQSRELLVHKKTVRKQQRRLATSRNPVRALAAREDLREEYFEIKSTGVAERELRRINVEKLSVKSTLAVEALAGLASKEDFTAVSLRKANSSPVNASMLPYKHPMLLQVKGRRHVQTRLVEPVAKSINQGDTYVLATQNEVYNWVGEYSNVIERSRSAEIAAMVHQKKDLGCSGSSQVITIGGGAMGKLSYTSSQVAKFWKILGSEDGSPLASEAGDPDEDELYEASIVDTNMAYEVKGEELVPLEEYWGCIPRIQMLDPSKVLVFDFGSELYVWNGKNASQPIRRLGAKLVKELWENCNDYSVCDANPLELFRPNGSTNGDSVSIDKEEGEDCRRRPAWALLGKVNQHMETVLFREKFLDWPDFSRVIRVKGSEDDEEGKGGKVGTNYLEVLPCDAKEMLESEGSTADLELEGSHLGRGDCYADDELSEIIAQLKRGRRPHEISTLGVTMWHVSEFEHEEVEEESVGQFHSGGTYVIRWHYRVTVSGRELGGGKSKHAISGRERCAYFCWQGRDASLNEKGAAALLTVELDKEKGPQVRLTQGSEPPAFLRIFKGCMVVHRGRRGEVQALSSSTLKSGRRRSGWRLYICRGAFEEAEAVLEEVLCGTRHLRSRASFVLIHSASGTVYVWHGAKSHQKTRKIALAAVNNLRDNMPPEFSFPDGVKLTVKEFDEGSEPKDFFDALGGGNRQLYSSLHGSSLPYDHTPRLFHLSSVSSGTFSATEALGPWRCGSLAPGGVPWSENLAPQAFPFLQSELYSASQPTLFLLDNHHEIWLWQGWWPEEDASPGDSGGEEENRVLGDGHIRGSGAIRWQAERRAAMQTALDYANLKAEQNGRLGPKPRAWLVWAGLEPLAFTNLFPEWTDRDDVAEINIREGKGGESLPVEQELARLTRSTYPVAQLLQRPLPEGVDPTRLELYLSPQHFQELLGMSKEEFTELPPWKQTNVKKEVGLF